MKDWMQNKETLWIVIGLVDVGNIVQNLINVEYESKLNIVDDNPLNNKTFKS